MAKRILEQHLEDLESELNHHLQQRQPPPQDFERRFQFLKSFLKAELAPQPRQDPCQISRRLALLETAFVNWRDFQTTPHDLETDSSCSCTFSCINEDCTPTVSGSPKAVFSPLGTVSGSPEGGFRREYTVATVGETTRNGGLSGFWVCGNGNLGVILAAAVAVLGAWLYCVCNYGVEHFALVPT